MASHPKLIIPQSCCEQFEKAVYANPHFYRIILIEGRLEITPETSKTNLDHLPNLIIPQSSYEQFEKTAYANPLFYRMNLIEGQLEIMPVHTETGTTY